MVEVLAVCNDEEEQVEPVAISPDKGLVVCYLLFYFDVSSWFLERFVLFLDDQVLEDVIEDFLWALGVHHTPAILAHNRGRISWLALLLADLTDLTRLLFLLTILLGWTLVLIFFKPR